MTEYSMRLNFKQAPIVKGKGKVCPRFLGANRGTIW